MTVSETEKPEQSPPFTDEDPDRQNYEHEFIAAELKLERNREFMRR